MATCLNALYGSGFEGSDIRSLQIGDATPAICYGDFLNAVTVNSCRIATLISSVAWAGTLLATQQAAKLVFQGVSLLDVSDDVCAAPQDCVPYENYVRSVPNKFRRAYQIVDAAGVAAPTTWVRGQQFSFGKNPTSNLLSNNTITKTTDAAATVFRAVEDSCGDTLGWAMVEFAT